MWHYARIINASAVPTKPTRHGNACTPCFRARAGALSDKLLRGPD